MEFLAQRWAPASVTEIAEATFNEPTTVSTHLRALRRDHLVRSLALGKERLYEIADPLHRIARAMKHDHALRSALARMAQVWAALDEQPSGSAYTISRWREALEDASTQPVGTAIDSSSVGIPLWIASGRNLADLRESLQARADRRQLPAAFERALAAEDTPRAFARLGAESRAFARDFLQAIAATELLARLPSEPSGDTD